MTLRAITNCKWQAPGKKESKRGRQHSRVQTALTKSEETRILDQLDQYVMTVREPQNFLGLQFLCL